MSTESIKVIKFTGKKSHWRDFERRFIARAIEKDFCDALEPGPRRTRDDPTSGVAVVVPFTEEEEKANKTAHASLTLSTTKRAAGIVDKSRTTERPGGDASLAWKQLKLKYKDRTITDKEELKTEFNERMLEPGEEPCDWMCELEVLQQKINEIKPGEKTEQDIITHVLHNLPGVCEGFVMKQHDVMAALPDGDEMDCEKFENELSEHHRRLVRLKKVGKTKKKEEDFACSVARSPKAKSPFPKQFKGRCRHCAKIGHKEANCFQKQREMREKGLPHNEERKSSPKSEDGPRIKGNCNWCQKHGHMERFCRAKKAGKLKVSRQAQCNLSCKEEEEEHDEEVAFASLDLGKIEEEIMQDRKCNDESNCHNALTDWTDDCDSFDFSNLSDTSTMSWECKMIDKIQQTSLSDRLNSEMEEECKETTTDPNSEKEKSESEDATEKNAMTEKTKERDRKEDRSEVNKRKQEQFEQ